MIFPGQSLTAEPKNAPYENPPQLTKPEEAVEFHLERLTETDRMDALMDALELDFSVVELTEGLLRGAVMDGRHTVDVSLIIAPIIHEFIRTSAEKSGVEFTEFDDSEEEEQRDSIRYQVNAKKAERILKDFEEDGTIEQEIEPEGAEEEEPEAPKGLMSRMSKLKEGV